MPQVKFVIEAEAAKMLQEALKVVSAQKRMEAGFGSMAAAGNRASKDAEKSVEGLRRKMEQTAREQSAQSSRVSVARTWNQTRGEKDLSLTAVQRQTAKQFGGYEMITDLRAQRAAALRVQRAESAASRQRLIDQEVQVNLTKAGNRDYFAMMARHRSRLAATQQRQADEANTGYANEADLALLRMEAKTSRKARILQMRQNVAQGVLMVGGAVAAYMRSTREQLDETARSITSFDDTMTPLYGVGNNMTRRGALREQVLNSAIVTGVDPGQIATMRFNLQSQASDRSAPEMQELIRSGIDFYRLQRADMSQTATAIDSAARSLKDELPGGARGIRTVRNKLAYAADVGAFEINDFAPYMSSVLASFKGMGFGGNAALAGSVVASQSGMRAETWTTALRNLPLLMSKAEEKLGRKLPQGDFGAAMKEVSKLESPDLLELVGRDTFAVAKIIGQNADALRTHTEALKKITADTDQLGEKLRGSLSDRPGMQAGIIRSAQSIINNEGILTLAKGKLADEATDAKLREAGASMEISPFWKRVGMGWMATTAEQGLGELSGVTGINLSSNNLRSAGARELINQYRTAGQGGDQVAGILSNYLELKYNPDNTYFYKKGGGEKLGTQYTGSADDYLNMATKGGYSDLSAGEYVQYQTMRGTDEKAAQAYLERVGKTKKGGSMDQAASNLDATVDKFGAAVDKWMQGMNQKPGNTNYNR